MLIYRKSRGYSAYHSDSILTLCFVKLQLYLFDLFALMHMLVFQLQYSNHRGFVCLCRYPYVPTWRGSCCLQGKRAYMWQWNGCEVRIRGYGATYCDAYQDTPNPSLDVWKQANDDGVRYLKEGFADLISKKKKPLWAPWWTLRRPSTALIGQNKDTSRSVLGQNKFPT